MLIQLLVIVIVIAVIFYVLREANIQQPWKNLVMVIVVVMLLIYLIGFLPGMSIGRWGCV